ncbi:MAG: hypothetical protein IT382_17300 [Deltaproteobacteria bacterium]|nr:hypothetical protein [Deltaproteobacteria bacterium]
MRTKHRRSTDIVFRAKRSDPGLTIVLPDAPERTSKSGHPNPIARAVERLRLLARDAWVLDGMLHRSEPNRPYQFFVALDLLEDTELALRAYASSFGRHPDFGRVYLLLFGALQALVVQQDALRHVGEALGLTLDLSEADEQQLETIRHARNHVAGHPTKVRVPGGGIEYAALVRRDLGRRPRAIRFDADRHVQTEDLDVEKWIVAQSRIAATSLRALIGVVRAEVDAHRRRFRRVSLAAILRERHVPARMAVALDARAVDAGLAKDLRASIGTVVAELLHRGLRSDSYNVNAYRDALRMAAGSLSVDRATDLRTRLDEFVELLADIDRLYRRRWRP